jgi:predicted HicB family RNase H-like nuclease
MDEYRFFPKSIKKDVTSIRIDLDLLAAIDAAAVRAQISRNEWIAQALRFALSRQGGLEEQGHD